jgi:hypothetical protein
MGVGSQRHVPASLPPAQRTDTQRNGYWVGRSRQPNTEHLQDANGHPVTGSRHGTAASVLWLTADQNPTIDMLQETSSGKAANRQGTPSSGLRPSAGERLSASSHLAAGYQLASRQWTVAH